MRLNKAFSLLELLFVVVISSFLIIYTFKFAKELNLSQVENEKIATLKIDLNSTKIIIEKRIPEIIEQLNYKNNILYINNSIFLKNVTSFEMSKSLNKLSINIELENKISQKWEFKL